MDQQEEYAAASQLAMDGRYRRARDSLKALLQVNPSHVEALVLSGKIEFYLRHPAASRQCFETALSYEPGNMAAFFGLEYYKQRRRLFFLAACVVLLFAAIAGAAVFITYRVSAATRQLDARLDSGLGATSAAFSASLDRVSSAVEELRKTSQSGQESTERALSNLQAELEKLSRGHATLLKEIEELRKMTSPGNQPPLGVP